MSSFCKKAGYGLLCLLFFVFKTTASWSQDTIDDRVVLSIAGITITGYEVEKNLPFFRDDYKKKNGHLPGEAAIDQWIRSFIDRAYFLADAYQKGYDTLPETVKWVSAMEHYVISSRDGLMEKTVEATMSPLQIQQELKRNLQRYYVRYIKFPDQNTAFSYIGNTLEIKNKKQFENLWQKVKAVKGITAGEDSIQSPFYKRGDRESVILQLQPDEISPLLTLADGTYLIQVVRIRQLDPASQSENAKAGIIAFTKRKFMESARQELYEKITRQANVKFDSLFMILLQDHLATKGNIREFTDNMFTNWRTHPALTYQWQGKTKIITAGDWMNYYNTLPLRQPLGSMAMIKNSIESMAYDNIMYQVAEEKGMTREKKFLLDKLNYRRNVMIPIYEREELKKYIHIAEEDMAAWYEQQKSSFTQATDAVVTAYIFPDRPSLLQGFSLVRNNKTGAADFKKISRIDRHRNIHWNDIAYTDSIQWIIFRLKPGEISNPLFYKGAQLLMVKESESGSRIQEFSEVKESIKRKLEEEALDRKKKEQLTRLYKQFPLTDQIDHSRYYNIINTAKN